MPDLPSVHVARPPAVDADTPLKGGQRPDDPPHCQRHQLAANKQLRAGQSHSRVSSCLRVVHSNPKQTSAIGRADWRNNKTRPPSASNGPPRLKRVAHYRHAIRTRGRRDISRKGLSQHFFAECRGVRHGMSCLLRAEWHDVRPP